MSYEIKVFKVYQRNPPQLYTHTNYKYKKIYMIIFNLKTKFTDDDPWVLNYKKSQYGIKTWLGAKG